MVGESEMTVKDETKVPNWISGIEWAVVNFSELLLEINDPVTGPEACVNVCCANPLMSQLSNSHKKCCLPLAIG